MNAMRHARQPGLLDYVMEATIPMRGRMIHGKDPTGRIYEHAQDYDAKGRVRAIPPGLDRSPVAKERSADYIRHRPGRSEQAPS